MGGFYEDFYANLSKTGVAKTSHFDVMIPLIPGLMDSNWRFAGYVSELNMRCESTELPGRQLVSNDSRVYGPTYKTPYQSTYQELTLNFLESDNFLVRDVFEMWIDSIFDSATNALRYPNDYRVDVTLIQYAMTVPPYSNQAELKKAFRPFGDDKPPSLPPIAIWKLVHAFPTAVNQMPVSWSEDGFHRVAVTLAYEYYEISKDGAPRKRYKKPPDTPDTPRTPGIIATLGDAVRSGPAGIISGIRGKFGI